MAEEALVPGTRGSSIWSDGFAHIVPGTAALVVGAEEIADLRPSPEGTIWSDRSQTVPAIRLGHSGPSRWIH